MPEETNTNEAEEKAEDQPVNEEVQEETQPETPPETEQSEEEPSEDIDIDKYWKDRYQVPANQPSQDTVAEVTKELSQLPTDESGTVDANAAAEWFAKRLDSVRTQAGQDAAQSATRAAMEVVTETAQQQQLLKKYPEVTKDRETLDAIFDLRDAAALRGEGLSLTDAAAKLDKLRKQAKAEGSESATRRTTIQAAAHLETSAVKGTSNNENDQLAVQAFQGSGMEAQSARRELLKRYVEREVQEGNIQTP